MKVKGPLEEASLQGTDTAGEAALRKAVAMVYYNHETNEIVVGNGTTFERVKVSKQHSVGEIKASMLTEVQFANEMDGTWTLADGKAVAGSDYETITGNGAVPDLRGMFLRGKNNGRSDGSENPGGDLALGTYQADELKAHSHEIQSRIGDLGTGFLSNGTDNPAPNLSTEDAGGDETRPRNITVNYFIKINR